MHLRRRTNIGAILFERLVFAGNVFRLAYSVKRSETLETVLYGYSVKIMLYMTASPILHSISQIEITSFIFLGMTKNITWLNIRFLIRGTYPCMFLCVDILWYTLYVYV